MSNPQQRLRILPDLYRIELRPTGAPVPADAECATGATQGGRYRRVVASTYSADLVLVPADNRDKAVAAVRGAGHQVAD